MRAEKEAAEASDIMGEFRLYPTLYLEGEGGRALLARGYAPYETVRPDWRRRSPAETAVLPKARPAAWMEDAAGRPERMAGHYDIAVIGLGPAGATLARLLSPRFRVLALDRKGGEEGFRKPCGGLLALTRKERWRAPHFPCRHVFWSIRRFFPYGRWTALREEYASTRAATSIWTDMPSICG